MGQVFHTQVFDLWEDNGVFTLFDNPGDDDYGESFWVGDSSNLLDLYCLLGRALKQIEEGRHEDTGHSTQASALQKPGAPCEGKSKGAGRNHSHPDGDTGLL